MVVLRKPWHQLNCRMLLLYASDCCEIALSSGWCIHCSTYQLSAGGYLQNLWSLNFVLVIKVFG